MSQPESTEIRVGILTYFNAYTVMLGLALVAMVTAIVLLVLELTRFEWDSEARTASVAAPRVSVMAPHILV